MAFSGSTLDAYPMMLQFRNWLETNPGAMNRSYDINNLKKRMRLILNDMRKFITDLPVGQDRPDPPECDLLFGGWSWQKQAFCVWRFYFKPSIEKFDFEPMGSGVKVGRDHPIIFAGTPAAVESAREDIISLLDHKGKFRKGSKYFDMEPFEVLRDIIRARKFDDVGGPPQLIKIYKHGNSQPFAVKWPQANRDLSMFGRPFFPGEGSKLPVIDPDNIKFGRLR